VTGTEVKQLASFVLIRLGWGAIASAVMVLGGVYFIVDNSLRGIESSIATMNERISDLDRSLGDRFDLSIQNLELRLKQEFEATRGEIKKASLTEPLFRNADGKEVTVALRSDAPSLEDIVEDDPQFEPWAREFGITVPQASPDSFFFTIGPSPSWDWKADIASGAVSEQEIKQHVSAGFTSPEPMVANGCVVQTMKLDGTVQLVPAAGPSIAGNDGLICLVDDAEGFLRFTRNF
jgi:hypothetical protein